MKVVTFGEIMMRLSPEGHKRIQQADRFDVHYGGAEANVAAFLAQMGVEAYFVTKVPDNPVGEAVIWHLRRFGVKTDWVVKGEGRLGIYFLEVGASQRPSKVVYDRGGSCISRSKPGDFVWEEILDGVNHFHFSGITPALGGDLPGIVERALRVAKEKGVRVSCDLNYRAKLWSSEEAQRVMKPYMEMVDILIANEEDIEKVLGKKIEGLDVRSGKIDRGRYVRAVKELSEEYGFEAIGITLRESRSASINGWSALLWEGGEVYFSKEYEVHVVDRVGAGDAFAGGLIYGFLLGKEGQEKLEFAVAASCLKHSIVGDFAVLTKEEVEKLAAGTTSARVER